MWVRFPPRALTYTPQMNDQNFKISPLEKQLVNSIVRKVEVEKKKHEMKTINFNGLFGLLDGEEQALADKVKNLNPRTFGFKGRYLGIQKAPKNLVPLRGQKYRWKGKTEKITTQYISRETYIAYKKLNVALYKDTGCKLLIASGYRSPAYQTTTFLWYLKYYKFNIKKTAKRVAMQGYSEHGYPKGQAVDFVTLGGIPTDTKPLDFAKTVEYKWLSENAGHFGFYESYPKGNKLGLMFEPWHWQYRGK